MPKRKLLCFAAVTACAAGFAGHAFAQQETKPFGGFYVGANVGGVWSDNTVSATVEPGAGPLPIPLADAVAISRASSDKSNKGGFTGGVQGGYNYVVGSWLFGLEADWEALDVKSTSSKSAASLVRTNPQVVYNINQRVSTDWMVTLRPRVGYIYDNWLFYGTGGFAWSQLKYRAEVSDNLGNRASTDTSTTKTGWAAGVGAAYAFTQQWSFRGEWLYSDFGHVGSATTNSFATVKPDNSVKSNLFRVGVDYRF